MAATRIDRSARVSELGWLVLGWGCVMLLFALGRDVLLWRVAAGLAAAAFALSLVSGWLLRAVHIEKASAARLFQGEMFSLQARLSFHRALPLLGLDIEVKDDSVQGSLRVPLLRGQRESRPLVISLRSLRRAQLTEVCVCLRTAAPWNLIVWQRELRLPVQWSFLPRPLPLREEWLRQRVRCSRGTARDGRAAEELEYFSLRDFREGDAERHVHLRHSARRGKKMLRVLRSARRVEVSLCIDVGMPGLWKGSPVFELGLRLVAALLKALLRPGSRVSLWVFAGSELCHHVPPGRDLWHYGDVLAAVRPRPPSLARRLAHPDPAASGIWLHFGAGPPPAGPEPWYELCIPSAEAHALCRLLPRGSLGVRTRTA